jgi:hypothetical protein
MLMKLTAGQFYQQITRAFFIQNFGAKKLQIWHFGFERLAPKILYQKCTRKMLMKLTAGVNLINMLTLSFYKHNCSGAKLDLFDQQNYAQLYQYTQLEVTTNYYIIRLMLSVSKININLLVQKLLIER